MAPIKKEIFSFHQVVHMLTTLFETFENIATLCTGTASWRSMGSKEVKKHVISVLSPNILPLGGCLYYRLDTRLRNPTAGLDSLVIPKAIYRMLGGSEGRIGVVMEWTFPTALRTKIPTPLLLEFSVLQIYFVAILFNRTVLIRGLEI